MVAFNFSDSPEPSTAKKSGGGRKAAEDYVEANNAPDWLPEGWIMELRYPTSGTKIGTTVKNEVEANHPPEEGWLPEGWTVTQKTSHGGRKYNCFVAPTGEKFYSKPEVLRHLEKLKGDRSSSKQQNFSTRGNSNENVCSNLNISTMH